MKMNSLIESHKYDNCNRILMKPEKWLIVSAGEENYGPYIRSFIKYCANNISLQTQIPECTYKNIGSLTHLGNKTSLSHDEIKNEIYNWIIRRIERYYSTYAINNYWFNRIALIYDGVYFKKEYMELLFNELRNKINAPVWAIPCHEIWFLLHFVDYSEASSCESPQKINNRLKNASFSSIGNQYQVNHPDLFELLSDNGRLTNAFNELNCINDCKICENHCFSDFYNSKLATFLFELLPVKSEFL